MSEDNIARIIRPRERDLGGFSVRRVLPHGNHPMVGPFIFFDHMGPATFAPGQGIDVRPHPHINLATVTYLFEGSLYHKDSVGGSQNIEPGAVNWMTAGRGIVHSERSDAASRAAQSRIHGIQSWLALPTEHEEIEPSFVHHPAEALPRWTEDGMTLCLIAGDYGDRSSPVSALWPMCYLDCDAPDGGELLIPDQFEDRALYLVSGAAQLGTETIDAGTMVILKAGAPLSVSVTAGARIMLIGGKPMPEPRHIWWNFVSSRLERIDQAKTDWLQQRFDAVPGESEFIPLPEQ